MGSTFSNSFIMPLCKLNGFSAGGDHNHKSFTVSKNSLKLKAIKIDRVSKVYPKLAWKNMEVQAWGKNYELPTHVDWLWKEFVQEQEKANRPYRTGGPVRTAFSLTITGGLRRLGVNSGLYRE
jgi:hypothetical protein